MLAIWKYLKAKIKQDRTRVLCFIGAALLALYIGLLWLGALESLRSQSSGFPASILIILFLLVSLFASSELKELIDRFRKWL
jgi:hypothetical protein